MIDISGRSITHHYADAASARNSLMLGGQTFLHHDEQGSAPDIGDTRDSSGPGEWIYCTTRDASAGRTVPDRN